jgi:hypothetical protein
MIVQVDLTFRCVLGPMRFQPGGNMGSNPVGDAKAFQELASNR